MRRGYGDGADLGKRHQHRPVFVTALQDDEHAVALADAEGEEIVRAFVGIALYVAEGEGALFPEVVAPYEGALVRLQARVFVHDVVGEIEVFRNIQAEIVVEVVVIAEFDPVRETAQKVHGWRLRAV